MEGSRYELRSRTKPGKVSYDSELNVIVASSDNSEGAKLAQMRGESGLRERTLEEDAEDLKISFSLVTNDLARERKEKERLSATILKLKKDLAESRAQNAEIEQRMDKSREEFERKLSHGASSRTCLQKELDYAWGTIADFERERAILKGNYVDLTGCDEQLKHRGSAENSALLNSIPTIILAQVLALMETSSTTVNDQIYWTNHCYRDRFAAAISCKAFYSAVKLNQAWPSVDLSALDEHLDPKRLVENQMGSSFVGMLRFMTTYSISPETVVHCRLPFPSVDQLRRCEDCLLQFLQQSAHKLQYFFLTCPSEERQFASIRAKVAFAEFICTALKHISEHCPNLRKLRCPTINWKEFDNSLSSLKGLEELQLGGLLVPLDCADVEYDESNIWHSIADRRMFKLQLDGIASLPNLRKLEIRCSRGDCCYYVDLHSSSLTTFEMSCSKYVQVRSFNCPVLVNFKYQ